MTWRNYLGPNRWQSRASSQWLDDQFKPESADLPPGQVPLEGRQRSTGGRRESGLLVNLTLLFAAVASAAVMTRTPAFAELASPRAPRESGAIGNPTLLATSSSVKAPFKTLADPQRRSAFVRADGPLGNAILPLGLGSTVAPAMTRAAVEPHKWSPAWRDDGPKRGIAPLGIGQGPQAGLPFRAIEVTTTRSRRARDDGAVINAPLTYAVQLYAPSLLEAERVRSRQLRDDGPAPNRIALGIGQGSQIAVPFAPIADAGRPRAPRRDGGPVPGLVTIPGVGSTAAPAMTRALVERPVRSAAVRDDGPKRGIAPLGIGQGAQQQAPFTIARDERLPGARKRSDGPAGALLPLGIGAAQASQPFAVADSASPRRGLRRDDGPVQAAALVYAVQLYAPYDGSLEPGRKPSGWRRDSGPQGGLLPLGVGQAVEPAAPAVARTIFFPPVRSRPWRDDGPKYALLTYLPAPAVEPVPATGEPPAGGGGTVWKWKLPPREPQVLDGERGDWLVPVDQAKAGLQRAAAVADSLSVADLAEADVLAGPAKRSRWRAGYEVMLGGDE